MHRSTLQPCSNSTSQKWGSFSWAAKVRPRNYLLSFQIGSPGSPWIARGDPPMKCGSPHCCQWILCQYMQNLFVDCTGSLMCCSGSPAVPWGHLCMKCGSPLPAQTNQRRIPRIPPDPPRGSAHEVQIPPLPPMDPLRWTTFINNNLI